MRIGILLPTIAALALAAGAGTGCRGWTSDQPPVHLNPNMDTQEKYKPYRQSDFFADGRGMRTPPEGTIAYAKDGHFLKEDDHYYRGVVNGQPATTFPAEIAISEATVLRGQNRYNIYCAPCHDRSGTGQGTVAQRLTVKPPSFHDDRIKEMSVGKIYEAILNGVNNGNMPPYRFQIPENDRWAIVLYLRALQRAQDPDRPSFGAAAAAAPAAPAAGKPAAPAAPAPAAPAHP